MRKYDARKYGFCTLSPNTTSSCSIKVILPSGIKTLYPLRLLQSRFLLSLWGDTVTSQGVIVIVCCCCCKRSSAALFFAILNQCILASGTILLLHGSCFAFIHASCCARGPTFIFCGERRSATTCCKSNC